MIDFLEASLVRPLALVVVAWLVLRVFRVQHPASRHAVWTAVLVGMLVLPIISVVGPRWTLPVLPTERSSESHAAASEPTVPTVAESLLPALPVTEAAPVEPATAAFVWPSTEMLIAGTYLLGVSLLLIYRILGWLLLRRVLARSRSLRPTCLRESPDVVTPVAVGVWRPSVILPAGWRAWDVRTRRAVFAHEFAHLRRRDTLVAALGRFVTSVLWFHPAAWWVSRKTSDLAELACDAVALDRVGDPGGYSRVLVEFAAAVNRSGTRMALPGLAIASGSRMNDRVDQVFEMSKGTMRRLARPRVWLAFGVPAMCLIATGMLGARTPQSTGPKFDVISIKPCKEEAPTPAGARGLSPFSVKLSPGYAYWDCVTVSTLILQAYAGDNHSLLNNVTFGKDRDHDVIKGAPGWTRSERFTIEARGALLPKYPSGYQGDLPSELRLMIRAMLEERFQLKMRHVTEERPLYGLSVAVGGPQIGPAAPTRCWKYSKTQTAPPPGYEGLRACGYSLNSESSGGDKVFQYSGASLDNVAIHLTSLMERNVVNRTGLEGRFDFSITFAADENTPGVLEADAKEAERAKNMRAVGAFAEQLRAQGIDPNAPPKPRPAPSAPNIFKAFELVGLKLEATKGPQEFLVVESVDRPKPNEAVQITPPQTPTPPQTAAQAPTTPSQTRDALASQAAADKAAGKSPKFDVVSIKPCPGVREPGVGRVGAPNGANISPGYLHFPCITLGELIDQTYTGDYVSAEGPLLNVVGSGLIGDHAKRVRGGPSWVQSDRFTIEARMSGDTTDLTSTSRFIYMRAALNPALRAMIEDRFQLKLHRATEQVPMYALTVAKDGLKIVQSAPGKCWERPVLARGEAATPPPGFEGTPACGLQVRRYGRNGNQHLEITHGAFKDFAAHLAGMMDRYVLDKTGVDGRYTFTLEYAPDDHTTGDRLGPELLARVAASASAMGVQNPHAQDSQKPSGDGPNIFKALEALGLKLEPTKGPAEYYQIDSVQKPRPNDPAADALEPPTRAQGAGLPRQSLGGGGR